MPRPRRSSGSDDEEDPDAEEDEEEPAPRRRRRPRPASAPHSGPVRRWHGSKDEEEDDEEGSGPGRGPSRFGPSARERHPVYWRARDSLYFEPLVAVAIVVVILVGLFAYTQNWPPVYVVESDSMQHGLNDNLGLINTGDLVLAQKVDTSAIVPYVVGLATGYSTYGEYGDVILYHPNGGGATPVIHRAIVYLAWDPTARAYNATELANLPCGTAANAVYAYFPTSGSPAECRTSDLSGTLELYHIGWQSVDVVVDLRAPSLGDHSGFLTMGDNNYAHCPLTCADQTAGISELVEPGWVIGVARGMIPWFGAVKLLIDGNATQVPPQSWQFMGLTVAGVILLAFGIHYALRVEGIETPLRKKEEDEAREEEEEESPDDGGGRARHWLRSLRLRRGEDDEEDDEDAVSPPKRDRRTTVTKATPDIHRRGRPRPRVRRNGKPPKSRGGDDL